MKFLALWLFTTAWCFYIPEDSTPKIANASKTQAYLVDDLFGSDEVLELKISGSIRQLFNDRGDNAKYHPLKLSYTNKEQTEVSLTLKGKTRGNFRRNKENCLYPPILLNFQKATSEGSIFQGQDKIKLVMPCGDQEHIVREYLVYKLYNIITPKSFRARLVKVNFFDSVRKKQTVINGFLIEEDDQMAARNKTKLLNVKNIQGESTETETFLKMAVFQYMIGNTDWSVSYLHNIRIIAFDSLSIPSVVPYDFDHSGIVNAPYALPPEQLALKSTQERRFRGYCITDWKTMDEVAATYKRLKETIYAVYTTNKLIDPKYVKATTRFLDEFYETINNPKLMKQEFSYPCKNGVPNIVIKGLQN